MKIWFAEDFRHAFTLKGSHVPCNNVRRLISDMSRDSVLQRKVESRGNRNIGQAEITSSQPSPTLQVPFQDSKRLGYVLHSRGIHLRSDISQPEVLQKNRLHRWPYFPHLETHPLHDFRLC